MVTAANTILYQYGALPFSITEQGAIKVLLVTTRGRRNWIIPKGWPIRNLTAAATATREAYEEAGLVGAVCGAIGAAVGKLIEGARRKGIDTSLSNEAMQRTRSAGR